MGGDISDICSVLEYRTSLLFTILIDAYVYVRPPPRLLESNSFCVSDSVEHDSDFDWGVGQAFAKLPSHLERTQGSNVQK